LFSLSRSSVDHSSVIDSARQIRHDTQEEAIAQISLCTDEKCENDAARTTSQTDESPQIKMGRTDSQMKGERTLKPMPINYYNRVKGKV
jgi:hypothetical protein